MNRVLWVVLILTALGLAACGNNSGGAVDVDTISTLEPVPAEYVGKTNPLGGEAVSAGAEIFKTNCEACHGAQGHGNGPAGAALVPAPKNLAVLQTQTDDDYLFWRINTGREGTAMVAWQGVLTEEQIWQVISFIRTLK